jgi:hypothetical protein
MDFFCILYDILNFPGWYFYEISELPSHKNAQKIYKWLSSLW